MAVAVDAFTMDWTKGPLYALSRNTRVTRRLVTVFD